MCREPVYRWATLGLALSLAIVALLLLLLPDVLVNLKDPEEAFRCAGSEKCVQCTELVTEDANVSASEYLLANCNATLEFESLDVNGSGLDWTCCCGPTSANWTATYQMCPVYGIDTGSGRFILDVMLLLVVFFSITLLLIMGLMELFFYCGCLVGSSGRIRRPEKPSARNADT